MKIIKSKKNIFAFLKTILPSNPIIIEAGSFKGKDTKRLSSNWPHGAMYAFEPVPEIFARLQQKTQKLKNISCFQLALSNTTGKATFYVSEKSSKKEQPFPAGSLKKPKERLKWSDVTYPKTISVQTMTLDAWAAQNKIEHVDFLWLDVQGNAYEILQGAQKLLPTIKAIWTEVEFIEAYENQMQYEQLKEYLASKGFQEIAKDFEHQTEWFFGNVLFVKPKRKNQ